MRDDSAVVGKDHRGVRGIGLGKEICQGDGMPHGGTFLCVICGATVTKVNRAAIWSAARIAALDFSFGKQVARKKDPKRRFSPHSKSPPPSDAEATRARP